MQSRVVISNRTIFATRLLWTTLRSFFNFNRFFLGENKRWERVFTTFPLFKLCFSEGHFEETVVQHATNGSFVHVLTNEHQHLLSVAVVVVPVGLVFRSGFFGNVHGFLVHGSPPKADGVYAQDTACLGKLVGHPVVCSHPKEALCSQHATEVLAVSDGVGELPCIERSVMAVGETGDAVFFGLRGVFALEFGIQPAELSAFS